MKKSISILLCFTLLMSTLLGCGSSANSSALDKDNNSSMEVNSISADEISTQAQTSKTDFSLNDEDMFTNRDYDTDYSESESVLIQLNGDSAAASSDSVIISGTTITITQEATYIISGTLDDGIIVVDADDKAKLQIVLNGVNIKSNNSAAIYVLSADKVFVTLADGTENILSNGGTFEAIDENNIDGAIYSKQDLTFNGSGTLTVTSPAGHGIVCKDDLVFTDGTYMVTSALHGFDVNDSVRIANASITINSGKDGIHAENTDDTTLGFVYISSGKIDIEAEGDGISAGSYLQVEDGTFNLVVGGGYVNGNSKSSASYGRFKGQDASGLPSDNMKPAREGNQNMMPSGERNTDIMPKGERNPDMAAPNENGDATIDPDESSTSMKGIKAVSDIKISNGKFVIDSADDSIHSNSSIMIDGGTFELASGDDAVHADDTITITSCDMNISKSYEGIEAQKLYVKGGTILLNSTDDGLNASGGMDTSGSTGGRDGRFGGGMHSMGNGVIEISGGNLTIYASGDGIDSNGTLNILDGFIYIANPTAGDTSIIDSDISPVISGGTFISTGSTTMMAQTFASSSSQGFITSEIKTQPAGSTVTVSDSNGNCIISYEVEYSCVIVIISSPDIVKGETYTLSIGSTSVSVKAE